MLSGLTYAFTLAVSRMPGASFGELARTVTEIQCNESVTGVLDYDEIKSFNLFVSSKWGTWENVIVTTCNEATDIQATLRITALDVQVDPSTCQSGSSVSTLSFQTRSTEFPMELLEANGQAGKYHLEVICSELPASASPAPTPTPTSPVDSEAITPFSNVPPPHVSSSFVVSEFLFGLAPFVVLSLLILVVACRFEKRRRRSAQQQTEQDTIADGAGEVSITRIVRTEAV